MKTKTKRKINAERKRIERAYYDSCSGIEVNIMDLGKIFNEGHRLLDNGADDEALRVGIRAFVETIRKN